MSSPDLAPRRVTACNTPDCRWCRAASQPGAELYREQVNAACADLALWSRSWAESVRGEDLCALVMGELASLYLDASKTEAEFVAAVQFAFRSVKAARDAIASADHPPEG